MKLTYEQLETRVKELEAKLKGLPEVYANVEELQKAWEELDDERKAENAKLREEVERLKLGPTGAALIDDLRHACEERAQERDELALQVVGLREALERINGYYELPPVDEVDKFHPAYLHAHKALSTPPPQLAQEVEARIRAEQHKRDIEAVKSIKFVGWNHGMLALKEAVIAAIRKEGEGHAD